MREAHAGALAAPRGVVGTRAALAEPAAAAARTIGLAFELRRIGGERGWGGALGAARAACRAHLIRRGAHRGEQDHRHRPTVAMRAWLPAAVYPATYPLPSSPSIDARHAKSAHEFVRIILRLLRNQEELVGAAQRVARGAPELCSPPIAIGAAHSRPPPPCVRRHTRRSPRRVSSLSAASEPSRRAQQTAPSTR